MSENNDGYFDVYDQQDANDLQDNGHDSNQADSNEQDDQEVTAIKKRVQEMEEEAVKLKQLQNEMEQQMQMNPSSGNAGPVSLEDKLDADQRSIYVGNVDYSSTAQELEAHFHGCGSINRVTILCDKFSGHPKGFAYVEFADKDAVHTAMALDDSLFKGRQIKVVNKRTNKPGITTTDRGHRGGIRGGVFRGRGAPGAFRGGYNPYMGGGGFRGRVARGRGRGYNNFYSPY